MSKQGTADPGISVSGDAWDAANAALAQSVVSLRLADVVRMQVLLASFDLMVADETSRGLPVRDSGAAFRAFTGHLSGLLHESTGRTAAILNTALTARGLPVVWAAFAAGAFSWRAVEAVVRHLGGLSGDNRAAYDTGAARIAAETVPQLLDAPLKRLHDLLDPVEATGDGATAVRLRGVRARQGVSGQGRLQIDGPEYEIASIWATVRRLAVAAHGHPGEVRTIQQLMYDILIDLILGGMQVEPGPADHAGPGTRDDASSDDAPGAAGGGEGDRAGWADGLPVTEPPAPDPGSASGHVNHDRMPGPSSGPTADDVEFGPDSDSDGSDDGPIDLMAAYRRRDPGAGDSGEPAEEGPPGRDGPFWRSRRVPPNITLHDDGSFTPADPFQRLGDPLVPQRKVIGAEILVMVPAPTVIGATDQPGKLAGWGSLPAAEVRRIVAAARHWTRVEVDPVDDAILAFDSSERVIPVALRRLIWLRDETCAEPGCPMPAHHADIDHAIRVEHGGRTIEINLSAFCRPSHNGKDDGCNDVTRTATGLRWADRWGGVRYKKNAAVIRPRTTAAAEDAPLTAGGLHIRRPAQTPFDLPDELDLLWPGTNSSDG